MVYRMLWVALLPTGRRSSKIRSPTNFVNIACVLVTKNIQVGGYVVLFFNLTRQLSAYHRIDGLWGVGLLLGPRGIVVVEVERLFISTGGWGRSLWLRCRDSRLNLGLPLFHGGFDIFILPVCIAESEPGDLLQEGCSLGVLEGIDGMELVAEILPLLSP